MTLGWPDLFYGKVKFGPLCFWIEKVEKVHFLVAVVLAAAITPDGKVPSNWEQSFIVCLYNGNTMMHLDLITMKF